MKHSIYHLLLFLVAALAFTSCDDTDERVPPYTVRIPFNTIGEWHVSGVGGAGDVQYFIKSLHEPSTYSYSVLSETGFGGVMLVYTYYDNQIMAYDMACPVELKRDVRVYVGDDGLAVCDHCGSKFNVFEGWGKAVKGKAAKNKWDLRRYRVMSPGPGGEAYYIIN